MTLLHFSLILNSCFILLINAFGTGRGQKTCTISENRDCCFVLKKTTCLIRYFGSKMHVTERFIFSCKNRLLESRSVVPENLSRRMACLFLIFVFLRLYHACVGLRCKACLKNLAQLVSNGKQNDFELLK